MVKQIGLYFKVFVWVTILIAIILPSFFVEKITGLLWAVIFPSAILSYIIGLIIERFGGDLLKEYYLTIEISWFKLSGTISFFTIIVFLIKFLLFK